ncbi:MAG: glycosyl hydrolase 115 family protein [Treponema sp.]|nr:glycosyl hydrolase 115 family protein [Treponema sp.]
MAKTLEATKAGVNRIVIAPPDGTIPEESWSIEVAPEKMTVCPGGSLGCVYALLYISEHFLGVTPFWYWNDQRFTRRPFVAVPTGLFRSPHYAVRFRGWFVNDEVLIENWAAEPENTEHWLMVFEALLRCGGNMVIPGTDTNSRKYRQLAADMGLWITHHHAEPLGAEMFSRAYPDKTPSYSVNSRLFEELWERVLKEQEKCRVIWGLGFRGQGDRPFWADDPDCVTPEQRGGLMSDAINRQYNILTSRIGNPVCCINLYGEIAELYRAGNLRLPSGVIKVWADNGYGCMVSRRQGNHNPRIHALPSTEDTGPHGIYYHCSFHDLQASNHLTMSPNPADFLAVELEKSLAAGAGEYWIINSGSVKPHVHTLALVSELWRAGHIDVTAWRLHYAKTYFGEQKAEVIAGLFAEYAAGTAKYGPNEDDRAGEQIWHHPVRELLCRWVSGDTESCVKSLVWLAGNASFHEQVKRLGEIAGECLPRWGSFCEKCAALPPLPDEGGLGLFNDSLYLQARLQRSGAAGTLAFCESLDAYRSGDLLNAFLLANRSRDCYRKGVEALSEAEHGKWIGYYDGDCLTDIRLTVFCVDALVSYLRVLGDGPDFHKWERDFMISASEKKVMLLSSKKRPLDNENLAKALEQILLQK